MAQQLSNEWHLRTVADTSSKPCVICHKPSTKVLITSDSKDFFYVCASHLQDRGFASPKIDEKAEKERREKEALQQEIELVKKEYEEKMKKKGKKKDDDKKKEEEKAEKERDEKIKDLEAQADKKEEQGPRIYILHRNFYQMRIDRLRNIEQAKRQQARLKDPTFFPSAPKNDLS